MKIESRKNIDGKIKSTVLFKGKQYLRTQKNTFGGPESKVIVEWRKCKTNHLVNAQKYKELEESYSLVDTTTKRGMPDAMLPSSGTTMLFDYQTSKSPNVMTKEQVIRKAQIDTKIREHLKFGSLLSAVKYYKDEVGVGLKEAKDYVDAINVIYQAEKRWEDGMSHSREEAERQKNALNNMELYFKTPAIKASFINRMKANFKDNKSALATVKLILDETKWGLYGSKLFFDTYIK